MKVHSFILYAKSEFFRSLMHSPMMESKQKSSSYSLLSTASQSKVGQDVFQMFIKYLYYAESAFDSIGNGVNLSVQDVLYLCECAEFYQIDDIDAFKSLTERKMSKSLDK